MENFKTNVLIGTVLFNPGIIRQYLKKSHYFLTYDPNKETLTLTVNHGFGGQNLFEVRNASHENAKKLAEGLGLTADDKTESPLIWGKWNPVLRLYHDGTADAEMLHTEMLRLEIPHTILTSDSIGLADSRGLHKPPLWTVPQMLQIIKETAEHYKNELTGTP